MPDDSIYFTVNCNSRIILVVTVVSYISKMLDNFINKKTFEKKEILGIMY